MPIRLWSTVVIAATRPPAPPTPARAARRSRRPSPQALQVRQQRLQFVAVERRSPASGCPASHAGDRGSSRRGSPSCSGSSRRRARAGSRRGSDRARPCRWRSCPRSCGSTRTPSRARPADPLERRRRGRRRRRGLRGEPRARIRSRGSATTHERHMGVLEAAVLGALPAEHPGRSACQTTSFVRPGIDVDLPVQRRHPEAVDHVRRCRPGRAPTRRPGCGSRSRSARPAPGSRRPRTTGGRRRRSSGRRLPQATSSATFRSSPRAAPRARRGQREPARPRRARCRPRPGAHSGRDAVASEKPETPGARRRPRTRPPSRRASPTRGC